MLLVWGTYLQCVGYEIVCDITISSACLILNAAYSSIIHSDKKEWLRFHTYDSFSPSICINVQPMEEKKTECQRLIQFGVPSQLDMMYWIIVHLTIAIQLFTTHYVSYPFLLPVFFLSDSVFRWSIVKIRASIFWYIEAVFRISKRNRWISCHLNCGRTIVLLPLNFTWQSKRHQFTIGTEVNPL